MSRAENTLARRSNTISAMWGLRNARLNFRQQEENHIMENIIYNELQYRDFNVDVGVVEYNHRNESGKSVRSRLEIDFVASKGSKKILCAVGAFRFR